MDNTSRLGEFDQAQTSIFHFDARDFTLQSSYFGLQLNETLLIAHVRGASAGSHLHLTRPFMLKTSTGASFSTSRDDGVYQDPRGGELLRGGVFDRSVDNSGNLIFAGQSGFWAGEVPETVDASFGESFFWNDSGRVRLTGRLLGPGLLTYVPSRDGDTVSGMAHTDVFYTAEGEMFGEQVSGYVILEHFFLPLGEILSDNPVRRRYVGAWSAFVSEFEDGTVQYGHFGYGLGPFKFANVVDGERNVRCPVVAVKSEVASDGLLARFEHHLADGDVWEFLPETNGALRDMIALVARRGGTTQVHKGCVGRVGETRTRRCWYAIQEWFPERLMDGASGTDDHAISGF